jgi:hypothetical protein
MLYQKNIPLSGSKKNWTVKWNKNIKRKYHSLTSFPLKESKIQAEGGECPRTKNKLLKSRAVQKFATGNISRIRGGMFSLQFQILERIGKVEIGTWDCLALNATFCKDSRHLLFLYNIQIEARSAP